MTTVATDRSRSTRKPLAPSPRSPSPRSLSPRSAQRKRRLDSIIAGEQAGKNRRRALALSVSPQEPQEPLEPQDPHDNDNDISEVSKSFLRKCTCDDAQQSLGVFLQRMAAGNFMGVDETRQDSTEAKKYIDEHKWTYDKLETFLNEASKRLISIIYSIFEMHGMGLLQSIENDDCKLNDMANEDEKILFIELLTERFNYTDVLDYSPQKPQEMRKPQGNEISEEAKWFIHKYTGDDAKRWLSTVIERITVNNSRDMVFADEDVIEAKKYIDDHEVEISSADNELLTFLNDAPKELIEAVYDNFDFHGIGLYQSIGEGALTLDDASTKIERICHDTILNMHGLEWNTKSILETLDYDNQDGY